MHPSKEQRSPQPTAAPATRNSATQRSCLWAARAGGPRRDWGRDADSARFRSWTFRISFLFHGKRRIERLFHAVVRRFLSDHHIMDVAFAQSRRGDANEAGFLGGFRKSKKDNITHPASEATDHLIG